MTLYRLENRELKRWGDALMATNSKLNQNTNPEIDLHFGEHEIVIKKRYEFFYNLNDILIAIWFIVGSIFFFWTVTTEAGTWLFLIGSIELLVRPFIRIGQKVHLEKVNS
ncbi:hypothetical protein GCM10007063_07000 [Lentibacillus kapialis]|uniref:YrhK domain-containing protein n=1 Tax=Lentibacillus kapialis TaxID=340214 RepID=A0A917PPW1_9BACI|nr:YrhK family protein [Lentibacillus kapialis]GGJ87128.1 hypothetical protein GCM10007063_07000 [Lentibacillus kapialis]